MTLHHHYRFVKQDLPSSIDQKSLFQIQEKVISLELLENKAMDNPEPYEVQLDDNTIKIKVADKWIPINSEIFQHLIVKR